MRALVVLVLILGFPVLEAVGIMLLADRFGFWAGGWLLLAAVIGFAMIRVERVLWTLRVASSLTRNRSPIRALIASARTVIAGVLLIFPGVISDAIALVVLLWPVGGNGPGERGADPGVIDGEFRRERAGSTLPRGGKTGHE